MIHAPHHHQLLLDAAFVPSEDQGTRLDQAHVVVLDRFLPEEDCQALLEWLTEPGWQGEHPPSTSWERSTCDGAGLPSSWGLKV